MKPTDPLEHPSGWSTSIIDDAVEIKRGISWNKNQEYQEQRNGTVPVLRIGNIQEYLTLDDVLYISGIKPEIFEQKRVKKGWTIIVGSNGNRDRVGNAILIREDKDFLYGSFLFAAHPKLSSGITPDYFYRWLSSESVQFRLSATSEGTTGLNNMSHSFFKRMAISFPDEKEQEAVTRILDAVDTALERTHDAIKRANEFKATLIHKLLRTGLKNEETWKSEAGFIPKSWDCSTLGDHIKSGPTNGLYRPESDYGIDGTRIIRIDNFDNGRIHDIDALKRVKVDSITEQRYALKERDILINRVNSLSHIGKAAYVPRLDEPTIFESNMICFECDEQLLPEFMILVLCSDIARKHWLSCAKPAVNQASINQRDVRKLSIPVPKPDEQREIVKIIAAIDNYTDQLNHVRAAQRNLKKSLGHDLLTGKMSIFSDQINKVYMR